MSDQEPSIEKAALRTLMRRRLSKVSDAEARSVGEVIECRLRESDAWGGAATVVGFASLAGEVETDGILASVLSAGKRLFLPRTIDDQRLEFAEVDDLGSLLPGRLGVREPRAGSSVVEFDGRTLILVPGLAFDFRGGRLGRGAGYYDRALGRARSTDDPPLCLGVGFALQVVDQVPMTRLDQRLDGVLTESGLDFSDGSTPVER